MGERLQVSIEVSDAQLERIARRAAEIVLAARQPRERSVEFRVDQRKTLVGA